MTHLITSDCIGCTACVKVCPTSAISGERKALHVINSAICIDCGACGRICPSKAIENEEGKRCEPVKRQLWLQPVVADAKCVACGACIEVCPTGVLEFKERGTSNLNLVPFLKDPKNCIGCGFCEGACPTNAICMVVPVTQ